MKYSDLIADWLVDLGYTHCFFLPGGNIMHLLESVSRRFTCVPVVHEVAASIAVEYFNESRGEAKAFALVTAGPGLTNAVTGIAGAFQESRDLLVIGGTVKTTDLARGQIRQRGIQEVDGVTLVKSITVAAERLDAPIDRAAFERLVRAGSAARKGPVFIEVPLDTQGRPLGEEEAAALSRPRSQVAPGSAIRQPTAEEIAEVIDRLKRAERPVLLIGGGVRRDVTHRLKARLADLGIPLMTTYNGADRVAADHPLYFGRPNTWGQRYSNILIQQADLIVALGTRLGLQQTGFNWQEFGRSGAIVQVDCDRAELEKGHPRIDRGIDADANPILEAIAGEAGLKATAGETGRLGDHADWLAFCREVKGLIPVDEGINKTREGYICPYGFNMSLSALARGDDIVVPCSSGGAFTVTMQSWRQKDGQILFTNKSQASMGYGLSGAIGCAVGHPDRRVILIEGDGGFAQNIQEIGTVAINALNLKMFIFEDQGYASIRMTQLNYFGGRYVGCDRRTGVGLPPDWTKLFAVWDVPAIRLKPGFTEDADFRARFDAPGPHAFIVPIDPEQTYFPKISSRVTASGAMESNPIHLMSPPLPDDVAARVFRHLPA